MKKLIFSFTLLALTMFMFQACKKDRTTVYVENPPITNPVNAVKSYPVGILSAWVQKAPQKQTFTIDASMGQWVTGAKGCMFYFPANALLDMSNNPVTGNVNIELIEYMNKADMLFSGVTVTAGNDLLESGGMFYLMAKKGGAELHLRDNSGFQMKIPQTNNTLDPMDIWAGAVKGNDSLNKINWVKKDSVQIKPKKDSIGCGTCPLFYGLQANYFKFGYCNIDREWGKFKTLVKKFRVKMPKGCNDTNSTALLLFKNYNCCAWCYWLTGEELISTHYNLPFGEIAKVLVYKKTGKGEDDLEYAVKEFTFTDETLVEFSALVKCTNAELEAVIEGL